jgi:hypothetical protein
MCSVTFSVFSYNNKLHNGNNVNSPIVNHLGIFKNSILLMNTCNLYRGLLLKLHSFGTYITYNVINHGMIQFLIKH